MFDYEPTKPKLLPESTIFDIQGNLNIPSGLWKMTLEHYPKEVVHNRMKALIERGTIPFPYSEVNVEEVTRDYNKLLSSEKSVKYGKWGCSRTGDIPLSYKGESLYLPSSMRHGTKVSDQYTQQTRMETGHQRFHSPMRAWTSDKKSFLNYLLNGIMHDSNVDTRALRSSLAMRSYIASQFKPLAAKALYNAFGAKDVLDFSAGWGDRLVGFHASEAQSYVGIDPNTKLHPAYQQIDAYCDTGKPTRFICSPAEDVDLSEHSFDFIFTSPPYFCIERYSDEETQSWKRYRTVESWLEGFLFSTLTECWEVLSEGGRIAVNISDAYVNSKSGTVSICAPMLSHMEKLGAKYEGVIGYQLASRMGANMENVGEIFCEPIFIWSKGEALDPKWSRETFFGV